MEQFIQRCIDGLKSVKFLREGKFGQFLISVLAELQKVTWPSKEDVKYSTVITLVVMVVMSIYMGGAQFVVSFIYDTV
ncbi:MAG: preprotein translocase subunit SecE, partial [Candidatus Omnitrophica bacterium]|nr:preprotein translocase subunit SecE [Candidatus Omnitrophota bacterium]